MYITIECKCFYLKPPYNKHLWKCMNFKVCGYDRNIDCQYKMIIAFVLFSYIKSNILVCVLIFILLVTNCLVYGIVDTFFTTTILNIKLIDCHK